MYKENRITSSFSRQKSFLCHQHLNFLYNKRQESSMSTSRRGFLSRIGVRRTHGVPPVVERFNLRISVDEYDDDDTASIHTILPAYSPRSNRPQPIFPLPLVNRPSSPPPNYYSIDPPLT